MEERNSFSKEEVRDILAGSFCGLDKDHITNLKWHLDNKTPIFCGESADESYFSEEGFA